MTTQNQAAKANAPRTAITPTRAENFPEWYQEVIKAADMAENSPVRGCMVIKPYGYAIWENIQKALDAGIKEHDVQNAYFPLLIPLSFISREAEHVEGFAKECAIVTHHRLEKAEDGTLVPAKDAELDEPLIIRPTSETIIGDSMSKWTKSYRDLPLKLNQWCNVMRWEMRTRLFLRSAEFLWQEGHNAFETAGEADKDARKMLGVYDDFYANYMAIPGFLGEKTADERFPGAIHSYTVEAMMQDGKSLQACTSHNLGQNFAHSCNIKFQGRDGAEHFAHTTSWGLSTRSIGGLIMTHSDDDGLMMPPRLAPYQVVILPIIKGEGNSTVMDFADKLAAQLKSIGVRVQIDKTDARAPDKMWAAIKRGVPIRVEIGEREVAEGKLTHTRRDIGRDSKTTCTADEFIGSVKGILDAIHTNMYETAKARTRDRLYNATTLPELKACFTDGRDLGFVRAPVELLDNPDYQVFKKDNSLSSRCLPFEDEGRMVLIGKSY